MPRPIKRRHVCCLPNSCRFGALDRTASDDVVIMTVDEYEAIRLIDLEGLTQEECAKEMNVARTTVQGIYNEARRKVADFIVNGSNLEIDGGEYVLCGGKHEHRYCHRHECNKCERTKEDKTMKIAIPVEEKRTDIEVCMSYGRTPYFAIYDMETREFSYIDNSAAAASGGAGIRASQDLINAGVTHVIVTRLGENAADVLLADNITIYKCNNGTIVDNIKAFEAHELEELTSFHAGFHGHHEGK